MYKNYIFSIFKKLTSPIKLINNRKTTLFDSSKFSKEIAKILQDRIVKTHKFKSIKNFPIVLGKQAMYILNWQKAQLTYSRGILEMLGYSKDEFTMDMALTWIHPDDIDVINRILKGVVNFAINNNVNAQKQYLNVTFRLLKKDGTYLRVMRQSLPYQTGEDGILITHLSVLTDISFMKTSTNFVEWELYAGNIDVTPFKKSIYHEFANFFTEREKEIIRLIDKGFTNKNIANELTISEHTVVTHRKNILKKSNCHNKIELIEFCCLNGIL